MTTQQAQPKKAMDGSTKILMLIVLGAILVVGVFALFGSKRPPKRKADTGPNLAKWSGLPCYVGSEASDIDDNYTGTTQFGLKCKILNSTQTVLLPRMTKVTVQKMVTDDDPLPLGHNSAYKVYLVTSASPQVLVCKANYIGHDEFVSLPLCPIEGADKARAQLVGRTVHWKSQKIGTIEIEPGTAVKIIDVKPYDDTYVDLTILLPSGATATNIARTDGDVPSFTP